MSKATRMKPKMGICERCQHHRELKAPWQRPKYCGECWAQMVDDGKRARVTAALRSTTRAPSDIDKVNEALRMSNPVSIEAIVRKMLAEAASYGYQITCIRVDPDGQVSIDHRSSTVFSLGKE